MAGFFSSVIVNQTSSTTVSILWTPSDVIARKLHSRTSVQKTIRCVIQDVATATSTCCTQITQVRDVNRFDLTHYFIPGKSYTIKISVDKLPGSEKSRTFVKNYDLADLNKLKQKAIGHGLVSADLLTLLHSLKPGIITNRVDFFCRNKPKEYYEYIVKHRQGVMEVYLKDNNGHPGSPINGRLDGLFFSADTNPPTKSPFGNTRLLVPSAVLYNQNTNLYFADFYCNNSDTHYVTLVITRPDTEADGFCQSYLVPLDKSDNPFLTYKDGEVRTGFHPDIQRKLGVNIHLELFYTENLPLDSLGTLGARYETVPSRGSSKPGGITSTRQPTCAICQID